MSINEDKVTLMSIIKMLHIMHYKYEYKRKQDLMYSYNFVYAIMTEIN